MPCAAAGPSTEGVDMTVGIDHNRGEKKYPYAKSRLTTVLGGMEHAQMMNLPHRLMSQLVILLTSVKPDMAAALNLIYGFWICAFKGVYQCQLGRLRMSVRLLVPTPPVALPVPSPAQPCPAQPSFSSPYSVPHSSPYSVPHSRLQLIMNNINHNISVAAACDLQSSGFSNRRMNRMHVIVVNPADVAVCQTRYNPLQPRPDPTLP